MPTSTITVVAQNTTHVHGNHTSVEATTTTTSAPTTVPSSDSSTCSQLAAHPATKQPWPTTTGDASKEFHDVFKLGMITTGYANYKSQGSSHCEAVLLWLELVEKNGGIHDSKDNLVAVHLFVEDGIVLNPSNGRNDMTAMKERATELAEKLADPAQDIGVHALLAPYTSTLTPFAAAVAEKYGIPAFAAGAAADSVYVCPTDRSKTLPFGCNAHGVRRFSTLYGTLPSATAYLKDSVTLANLKGSRTIALIRETASFTESVTDGIRSQAEMLGLDVVAEFRVGVDAEAEATGLGADGTSRGKTWDEALHPVAETLARLKPDMVTFGSYQASCEAFMRHVKRMNYMPPAVAFTVCVGSHDTLEKLTKDVRFMVGSSVWSDTVSGTEYIENNLFKPSHFFSENRTIGAPELFSKMYSKSFGISPTYHAASMMGCLILMEASIGLLDLTTSVHLVHDSFPLATTLRDVYMPSMLGILTVNAFGRMDRINPVTLQYSSTGAIEIVAPLSAASSDLVYPAPAWTHPERNFPCESGTRVDGLNDWVIDSSMENGWKWANTTCEPCPMGYHSSVKGMLSCLKCPVNTFAANYSTSQCMACPTGSTTRGEMGKATCSPCEAGDFHDIMRGTCSPCAAGTFSDDRRTLQCTSCKDLAGNQYQDEAGKTSCKSCPANAEKPSYGILKTECNCKPGFVRKYNKKGDFESCIFSPRSAVNIAIIATVCLCIAMAFLIAGFNYVRRQRMMHKRFKDLQESAEYLREVSQVLLGKANYHGPIVEPDTLDTAEEITFVVTDLQDSTMLSALLPKDIYESMLQSHDQVMRTCVRKYGGYEITTQGDSFEIAFTTSLTAIEFCLEVQEQLVNVPWHPKLLGVTGCTDVLMDAISTMPIFRGPRVRMGIHKGVAGTFTRTIRDLTRTVVYDGPAVEICKTLSDSSHGGQVLLTREAAFDPSVVGMAHKCVLEVKGTFSFKTGDNDKMTIDVCEAHPGLESVMPWRIYDDELRNATMEKVGAGFNLRRGMWLSQESPPEQATIAVVRLETSKKNTLFDIDHIRSRLAVAIQMCKGEVLSVVEGSSGEDMYESVDRTTSLSSSYAQTLEKAPTDARRTTDNRTHADLDFGILPMLFNKEKKEKKKRRTPMFVIGFDTAIDACKFACLSHAVLLQGWYDDDVLKVAPPSYAKDGELIYRGPLVSVSVSLIDRFACIVHGKMMEHGAELETQSSGLALTNAGASASVMMRTNSASTRKSGPSTVRDLATSAMSFLAMNSPRAMKQLAKKKTMNKASRHKKPRLIEAFSVPRVIHLDSVAHAVSLMKGAHSGQTVVSEKVWDAVGKRLSSYGIDSIELGAHVLSDESTQDIGTGSEQENLMEIALTQLSARVFPAFGSMMQISAGYREAPDPSMGVAIMFAKWTSTDAPTEPWVALFRRLLNTHNGYECKAVDGSDDPKLTIAFKTLTAALEFATRLQLETAQDDGKKPGGISIGCAFGTSAFKKPVLGRADYFGILPNLAARVFGQTRPGQTLVHADWETMRCDLHLNANMVPTGHVVFRSQEFPVGSRVETDVADIMLRPVGVCKLKGIGRKELMQAHLPKQTYVPFEAPKGLCFDDATPDRKLTHRKGSRTSKSDRSFRSPITPSAGEKSFSASLAHKLQGITKRLTLLQGATKRFRNMSSERKEMQGQLAVSDLRFSLKEDPSLVNAKAAGNSCGCFSKNSSNTPPENKKASASEILLSDGKSTISYVSLADTTSFLSGAGGAAASRETLVQSWLRSETLSSDETLDTPSARNNQLNSGSFAPSNREEIVDIPEETEEEVEEEDEVHPPADAGGSHFTKQNTSKQMLYKSQSTEISEIVVASSDAKS